MIPMRVRTEEGEGLCFDVGFLGNRVSLLQYFSITLRF